MVDSVRVFRAGEGDQGATTQTEGLHREELLATEDSWAGMVRTAPGSVSGWHHHGEYNTYIYGVSGATRLEYGAGGKESVEGEPGDVFYVPKGLIHREIALGPEEGVVFLVRVGHGPPVINVEGPEQ